MYKYCSATKSQPQSQSCIPNKASQIKHANKFVGFICAISVHCEERVQQVVSNNILIGFYVLGDIIGYNKMAVTHFRYQQHSIFNYSLVKVQTPVNHCVKIHPVQVSACVNNFQYAQEFMFTN